MGGKSCCDDDSCAEGSRECAKGLGLGLFPFEFEGEELYAHHATHGEVVGTDCGPSLLHKLVLISPSSVDHITSFCNKLIADADATNGFKFTVYRFHVRHQYWGRCEVVTARHIDSVVLPSALKERVVNDLDDFVEKATKTWYLRHGIPYKRSYLLFGSPGAGKTSLIQAIAGRYKRNVCYLSPSHPEMTDDTLKTAVQRVPAKSIIVLEDVDSLFASDGRHKAEGDKSALTFSGVLNALDGVGGADGQIFILTTNHRERLDPALIRNGRVDMHVEFSDATEEQMAMLFAQFYTKATPELATKFASKLSELLGDRSVSMALLQSYFIAMRKKSAEEASTSVSKVLEEAEAHGAKLPEHKEPEQTDEGDKAATSKGKQSKQPKKDAAQQEEDENVDEKAARPKEKSGREVHVHVHVD